MTAPSLSNRQYADVFIRWVVYTQLCSIAVGVLLSYLPTGTSKTLQAVFLAGFLWLMLSCYVYPIIILVWTVACGKRLVERLIVLLAEAILLYVQVGVGIVLH